MLFEQPEPASGMIIVPPLVQRLRSIAHTKFAKTVVLMFVDGREADPKMVGDFLEWKAFCNQCHDLVLAHGQRWTRFQNVPIAVRARFLSERHSLADSQFEHRQELCHAAGLVK